MPNSDPGTKLLLRPVSRPTTANASNDLVPSATPNTNVSTYPCNTTPVQTDKSQTDHPVGTAHSNQASPPPSMTHDVDGLSDHHHITNDWLSIRKDMSNFKKKKKIKNALFEL